MLLLNKKTPQKLIENVIKMDEVANNLYKKTLHVLQDRSYYLAYIKAEQAELDHKNMIKYAEEKGEKIGIKKGEEIGIKKGENIGIKKGEKIGVKKGEEIGIKKGEKIGVKKGKIEEKFEIAIKLKKLDMSIKQIAEITGIPMEKIKEL